MIGVLELILCDIGNTTFHFLINGKHKKYFLDKKVPKFDEEIYFVSVNEKATKKLLKKNPKAKDIKEILNFETKYQGLGIDRKIACSFQKDVVVVDAGSAITVDIMENDEHKGGFILLGVQSFINAYPKISKKLKFDFEKNINLDKIPLRTFDAIQYAMLKSIILPIKEVSLNKKIIFTGGDGEFLSKYFENSIYKKDLIFENMKRIIDANNCIA
ncbi:type III pantothenate kinase [Aliarcobacter butzleri]|uniref:type III pantothenate kinase n=1 Tax=Aliarcobacter butzleri TaxID=28197 RepID=UPI00069A69C1|nr:type III pantothenate kinase [Aliarcobacter butzleri]MDN5046318.1 type III pantothenate kinase [Aliarcobacter butzleri]MDN5058159.1 type III pantothenate kinase [Aliarcobacter butzleri]MDN5108648.1 type III pantothenate kinase [Aliarcobacter butzleri]